MDKKRCIVVDVDGVILNFSRPFSKWFNETRKLVGTNDAIVENPTFWGFSEKIDPTIMNAAVDEFMQTDPTLPLIEESVPMTLELLSKTYEIHLLTSCSEKWTDNRLRNLSHFKIKYDSIQFCASENKLKYAKLLNPICVIEDKPSTILSMCRSDIHVIYPVFWNYCENLEQHLHDSAHDSVHDSVLNSSKTRFLHNFLNWSDVPLVIQDIAKAE
jgi:hypothetical protein